MYPGTYNIRQKQGSKFSRVLTYYDENDALVDLTGYTARMSVKDKVGGTTLVALTTDDSTIVLGGAAGTITLSVVATTTKNWTPGSYVYDLELLPAADEDEAFAAFEGSFTVVAEVTT